MLGHVRRMVMVGRERRDDGGAQPVGFRVGQLQCCRLLQMVVQQPGVVEQALQDQGFAPGDGAALAAHQGACRQLRTCRLVGSPKSRGGHLWTAGPGIETAGILAPAGDKTAG